ncbi:MAG: hypothetical protein HY554_10265, partial [Elusimicrobia bacterium]|nr:hypothetical protein [Elusimicrobiota bacterium]
MTEPLEPDSDRRLLPLLIGLYRDRFIRNFEGLFVFSVLLLLGFILY